METVNEILSIWMVLLIKELIRARLLSKDYDFEIYEKSVVMQQ